MEPKTILIFQKKMFIIFKKQTYFALSLHFLDFSLQNRKVGRLMIAVGTIAKEALWLIYFHINIQ